MLEEKLIEDYVDSLLRTTGEPAAPEGVRLAHVVALRLILKGQSGNETRQYSVSNLTTSTGMKRPNVTRLLNDMQMEGLITRQREGRNVYVTVTDTGRETYEKGVEDIKTYTEELIRALNDVGISDDELGNYLRTSIEIRDVRERLNKKFRERKKSD